MTTEERVLKLENAFSTLAQIAARQDARMADTERSIRLLLELAQVQSSRIDDGDERQKQTDAHLDVLGQRMTELAAAQINTERLISSLTEHVDRLAETVERHIAGGA